MTSAVQVLAAGGGGIVSPLPGGMGASGTFTLPGSGSASCVIQSNGYIDCQGNSSAVDGNWFLPNIAGIGNNYWVRVTATGDTPSGTLNTWLALSSNRTFTLSSSSGDKSCTLTIEIASDSGGANIVTSGSCTLTVTEVV